MSLQQNAATPRPLLPAMLVILAGVSAALHVGKLAPALPALQQAMAISLLQAGFLLSLVQFAGMTLGLAVGLAADGLGLRRSIVAGLFILFLAGALGASAQSAIVLLSFRALEGFGFLLVVTPAPSLIRQLVNPSRLSGALGLWGGYMPLGAGLALLLGGVLIARTSWQTWWLLLASLSGVMALVIWRCIPSDAQRRTEAGRVVRVSHAPLVPSSVVVPFKDPTAVQLNWQVRLRQTLTHRGPWLVALCFAAYSGQWLAVVGFLPTVYAQAGVSVALTGPLTALAAAINIVGNVMAGRLLQRGWKASQLLYIGFCAMALGALITFGDASNAGFNGDVSPVLRYVAVLLFSGVGGLIPGTLFSVAVRVAPSESTVSTTVGWMQQLSAVGQFFGPPLVAWVAQSVGGWRWTWLATGLCSVLGLVLASRLKPLLVPHAVLQP